MTLPHRSAPMMDTLLLTRDDKMLASLRPLLETAGAESQVCADSDLAVELLARWKFDAVFVDCDEVPHAIDVLQALRAAPSNRTAVAFAFVRDTTVRTAFQMGATFVVTKPIARERLRTALRAAQGLMILGRRRYHRRPIMVPASFVGTLGNTHQFWTTNLSEGGVGVRSANLPKIGERGSFICKLPGVFPAIEATAEVVWAQSGQAGLQFLQVASSSLNSLRAWIQQSFGQEVGTKDRLGMNTC